MTRPQQARQQPEPPTRAALPVATGLFLTASGAIMLLAVHVRVPFLDLPAVGLILMTAGLAWLWIPVRAKSELVRRHFDQVMTYLQVSTAEPGETRCPLAELLADRPAPAGGAGARSLAARD